jgi:hypothetical protein
MNVKDAHEKMVPRFTIARLYIIWAVAASVAVAVGTPKF